MIFECAIRSAIEVRILSEVIEGLGWAIESARDVMSTVVAQPPIRSACAGLGRSRTPLTNVQHHDPRHVPGSTASVDEEMISIPRDASPVLFCCSSCDRRTDKGPEKSRASRIDFVRRRPRRKSRPPKEILAREASVAAQCSQGICPSVPSRRRPNRRSPREVLSVYDRNVPPSCRRPPRRRFLARSSDLCRRR